VLGEEGTDCIIGLERRGKANGGPSYEYAQCAERSQKVPSCPLSDGTIIYSLTLSMQAFTEFVRTRIQSAEYGFNGETRRAERKRREN